MKKLLTILILFCSAVCFSQAPRQLNAYNPNTQVNFLGTVAVDSGFVFRFNFPDTATANLGWIKNIPNVLVTINDTLNKRSNDATHWMQVGSGSGGGGNTIYTGDGSLSGDRQIDLNGHELSFVNGEEFEVLNTGAAGNTYYYLLSAANPTGGGNTTNISGEATDNLSDFNIFSNFNDGEKLAQIISNVSASGATIGYTADTHTFNGVLNLTIQAAPASPNDGDIWREDNTNTGLKIRVNGITKTISLL